ncbi:response regulator [Paenactinomyces guangxiensis]|uniref:Response regulator n=1 Tax=Paenactinomyces guangxiensis TaxID=1490290 RepID=A0A7W1WR83_9BACL|nr:response regulator [Paenactinomyces guangxiensis]MBA4494580.1 response regulator [Paenactinomyces guangxiensis]MBH8591657.1 response regulator [Paenactinomyces guangxiensis]
MNSILLVDDERWVRTALRYSIKKLFPSFQIAHECENGLEALDWMKQNQADLILTDIRMPLMDGLVFIKQLREENEQNDIIIISGYDDFPFVQEALRLGVTDYLLKPVQDSDLKQCLEQWKKKRSRAEKEENSKIDNESFPPSTIERVLQYIKETPLREITLAETAKQLHVNPSYLSQLFKQHLNKNFVDYVTEQRIEEAKRLLTATSLRMSEIAERLGYSDLAYFSNIFKRMTGSSPSNYRKSSRSL